MGLGNKIRQRVYIRTAVVATPRQCQKAYQRPYAYATGSTVADYYDINKYRKTIKVIYYMPQFNNFEAKVKKLADTALSKGEGSQDAVDKLGNIMRAPFMLDNIGDYGVHQRALFTATLIVKSYPALLGAGFFVNDLEEFGQNGGMHYTKLAHLAAEFEAPAMEIFRNHKELLMLKDMHQEESFDNSLLAALVVHPSVVREIVYNEPQLLSLSVASFDNLADVPLSKVILDKSIQMIMRAYPEGEDLAAMARRIIEADPSLRQGLEERIQNTSEFRDAGILKRDFADKMISAIREVLRE